jgi:hypothetical protein
MGLGPVRLQKQLLWLCYLFAAGGGHYPSPSDVFYKAAKENIRANATTHYALQRSWLDEVGIDPSFHFVLLASSICRLISAISR